MRRFILSALSIIALVEITSLHIVAGSAPAGNWDNFNLAPDARVVWPKAIKETHGTVKNVDVLTGSKGTASLSGEESFVTLDFGKEVGGLISMNIVTTAPSSGLALSFTESPMFISPLTSDDSASASSNMSYDGILHLQSPLNVGLWNQPSPTLRGGFRFLTIVSTSSSSVSISNVSCTISFMPHVENMRGYSGYFFTKDPVFHDSDFLTKIWYSGAYTVQTNTVPVNTGRQVTFFQSPSWRNNATIGVASPIIVDGAKRDRAVWPGDMGVAVPTQFVSTNDLLPTRNALSTMFSLINPTTGALPQSGPPLSIQGSDSYHAWTLIGTYNYHLYSGDTQWLTTVWANYTKAVAFLEGKVDSSGLMNITGLEDWARLAGGGHSSPGNALLYKVLVNSAELASLVNDSSLASQWSRNASNLKTTFNNAFWLPEQGMYRDNLTTTLCPQDANSMAVMFNLTTSPEQATSISKGLTKNWNYLGAIAPELPDTISPFIGSLELQAHFIAGNDDTAMDLLRREWGYMLYTNISVQSTLLEGFTANGSLGYRSYRGYHYDTSYTSHAHGWSSGPTSALTFYVLGLTVTSPQGKTWSFDPHLSGLSNVEGGFETPLGWFGASWKLSLSVAHPTFSAEVNVPRGTGGQIHFPASGSIVVNGKRISGKKGDIFKM